MKFQLFGKRRKKEHDVPADVNADCEREYADADGTVDLSKEKVDLEKISVDLNNKMLRLDYIQRLYEGIREAKRQCGDIKTEYGQVTSYLKDIQLIDQAQPEEKNELLEAAKAIVELTIRRQGTLRLVSKVLGGMLAMFGILILTIWFVFQVDIQVPFVATAAFAFVVLLVIVLESRKNRTDMVITERKCNRAIALANRTKIKYVNNTRTIDYLCSKYKVRNATELEFVYDQYRKAKREWAKQREDAFLLNEKNEILLQELEALGVKDKSIWLHQANAIVEPKEIRHSLN